MRYRPREPIPPVETVSANAGHGWALEEQRRGEAMLVSARRR